MFLIDTDILIYCLKGEKGVVEHFKEYATQPKAVSVISYGELFYGAMKSERRNENLAKVRRIAELFHIVPVSMGVMETFGSIKAEMQLKDKSVDDFDLVIASTALVMSSRLVTNNDRHFRHIPGLETVNWTK